MYSAHLAMAAVFTLVALGCDSANNDTSASEETSAKATTKPTKKSAPGPKADPTVVAALKAVSGCKLENDEPVKDCPARTQVDELIDKDDTVRNKLGQAAVALLSDKDAKVRMTGAWALGEYASVVSDPGLANATVAAFANEKDAKVRPSLAYAVSLAETSDAAFCKQVAGFYAQAAKDAQQDGKPGEDALGIALHLNEPLDHCAGEEATLLTVAKDKAYPWRLREDAVAAVTKLVKGKKSQPVCDMLSMLIDTELHRDSDFIPEIVEQAKHCPELVSKLFDTVAEGLPKGKYGAAWLIYLSRATASKDLTDDHKKKLRHVADVVKKNKDASDSEKKYADEILAGLAS